MSVLSPEHQDPEFLAWLVDNTKPEDRTRYGQYLRDAAKDDALRRERAELERDWRSLITAVFPSFVKAEFADFHGIIWDWFFALQLGVLPSHALVADIFRGGAKSSSAEMGVVMAGATQRRRYALYVCEQQERADDHVQNAGFLLESPEVEKRYPEMADRMTGKYGNSKGWRRERLRCANGFTVDAVGLDTARRGVKLEDMRPDLIIFDDIDKDTDSPKAVRKKISLMTGAIMPAGDLQSLAVAFFQNTIHANSIMAKVVSREADFLRKRVLIGPIPGFRDFTYDEVPEEDGGGYRVSGRARWAGFGIPQANSLINLIGPKKFREEVQHEVHKVEGAHWSKEQINAMRVTSHPDLLYIDTGVDPSGTDDPQNDEQGIVTCGLGVDGVLYVLADNSGHNKPRVWGEAAVNALVSRDGDLILGETNYGGDMVEDVVSNAAKRLDVKVKYHPVTATRGKVRRIAPVAAECGNPEDPKTWASSKVKLVGHFPELEDEMTSWHDTCGWSPNRLDGLVWCATHRIVKEQKKRPRATYRRDEGDDLLDVMELIHDGE